MGDPARQRHEDERLSALLDDELSEDDALEVTRHLARCDRCLAELEGIRGARAALRGLPGVDPPAELFRAAERAAARAGRQYRRLRRGLVAAAVLAAAATAVVLPGTTDGGSVVPPVDAFVVQHVTRAGTGPLLVPVDMAPARR